MKSLSQRRINILRRVEAADSYLKFEEYSEHEIGGFEQTRTPDWEAEEAYEIMQLVRRGLLEISETKGDEPWLMEAGPEPVYKETYVFLTPAGHDFLEELTKTWWAKQIKALSQNIVSIFIAVIIALAVSWASYFLGAPEKNTDDGTSQVSTETTK